MKRVTVRPVLAGLLAGAVLSTGCAVDPQARVRGAEARNRELSAAVLAADQAVQPAAAYVAELSSPQNARGSFSMYYSPASLEGMSRQMMPYQMSGGDFHRQLTGTIYVERLGDIRFLSRNRLTCRAYLRGENIRYTGKVPSFAKAEVEEFQRAVASGGYADLEVQLTLKGNQIHAQTRATGVHLNAKSGHEGELVSAMNERAFNRPFIFDATIPGSSQAPRRLMVTGNHVVVTYQ